MSGMRLEGTRLREAKPFRRAALPAVGWDLEPFPWDQCGWVPVPAVGAAAGVGAPRGSSRLRGLFHVSVKSRAEQYSPCYLGTVSVGYEQKSSVSPGLGAAGCTHPRTPLFSLNLGGWQFPAPGTLSLPLKHQPPARPAPAEVHVQADSSNLPPLLEISFPSCPGGKGSRCFFKGQG